MKRVFLMRRTKRTASDVSTTSAGEAKAAKCGRTLAEELAIDPVVVTLGARRGLREIRARFVGGQYPFGCTVNRGWISDDELRSLIGKVHRSLKRTTRSGYGQR